MTTSIDENGLVDYYERRTAHDAFTITHIAPPIALRDAVHRYCGDGECSSFVVHNAAYVEAILGGCLEYPRHIFFHHTRESDDTEKWQTQRPHRRRWRS